jgi:polyhydroxybutyrate depolymerase
MSRRHLRCAIPLLLGSLALGAAVPRAWAQQAAVSVAGCALAVPASGWHTIAVRSGGSSRSLRLYLPSAVKTGRRLPLVFDLHASGGSGAAQAILSGLPGLAERHGFVLAEPDGGISLAGHPGEYYWHLPGVPLIGDLAEPADAPDEARFIGDALDQIAAMTCLDARRVYVTGMSGGARMASWLACRLADRIAAVAPVAGIRAGTPLASDTKQPDPASCQPARPMSLISFHSVNDPVNPYAGGGYGYWGYGVDAALQRWQQLDHCRTEPASTRVAAHVTRLYFGGCAQGAEVILYRNDAPLAQGGGHVWPGSSAAADRARAIDASELLWQFFRRHPLPAAASSGSAPRP